MDIDKRKYELLYSLCDNQTHTIENLATELRVSKGTIRNDLRVLEPVMKSIGCHLTSKRGRGIELIVEDEKRFQNYYNNILSRYISCPYKNKTDKRYSDFYDIVTLILNSNCYLTQEEMADRLFISKARISKEFRKVKTVLRSYSLEISRKSTSLGMVTGSEFEYRMCTVADCLICPKSSGNFCPDTSGICVHRQCRFCTSGGR
jgi:transcriptional antiterminator